MDKVDSLPDTAAWVPDCFCMKGVKCNSNSKYITPSPLVGPDFQVVIMQYAKPYFFSCYTFIKGLNILTTG